MKTALFFTSALCLCAPALAQQAKTTAPASSTTVAAPANAAAIAGTPLIMRGINAGVQDALTGWPQVMTQFPGMTALRLNSGASDSMANISTVVQEYTGAGVIVEIEDHTGNPDNVQWYTQLAQTFKSNPRVYLEMPNEPVADASTTAQNQIGIIKAIRSAGFTNPIGVQPVGGYDFSNLPAVIAALGTTGLFVTPHIYYSGTDPNGAVQYVQSDIQQAQALGLVAVIDEFGNAMDGVTLDPQGNAVILAVIAANEGSDGGTVQAGAIFWAMDNGNHPDGTDSAFLDPTGSQLTPVGQQMIQPWLYTANTVSPAVANAAQAPEIAAAQQQLQAAVAAPASGAITAPPTVPTTAAPETLSATGQAALEQRIDNRLAQFGLTATFSPLTTTSMTPATSPTPSATPLAPIAAPVATTTTPAATELSAVQGELNTVEQQVSTLQQEIVGQPGPPAQETPAQAWQAFQAANPTFNAPQQGGGGNN